MVVGAPLAAVGAAAPGDVVLCSAARDALGELIEQERIDSHYSKVIAVTLPDAPAVPSEDEPVAFEELRQLLPPVVLERGAALDGRWLAEFRNLSIVQVCLSDIRFDGSLLTALEGAFSQIENTSLRLEGTSSNATSVGCRDEAALRKKITSSSRPAAREAPNIVRVTKFASNPRGMVSSRRGSQRASSVCCYSRSAVSLQADGPFPFHRQMALYHLTQAQ
jgi:hypothetical protein